VVPTRRPGSMTRVPTGSTAAMRSDPEPASRADVCPCCGRPYPARASIARDRAAGGFSRPIAAHRETRHRLLDLRA
jgi:hypothetical protein